MPFSEQLADGLPTWRGGASADGTRAGKVWTVSELNRMVRDLVSEQTGELMLRAEVGNLTIHRSGHVYLTLKDNRCQVSAVFFRGADVARGMALAEGMDVEVTGRLSVYEPRGQYQVVVASMRPCGVGSLQKRFEELRTKLRAEGVFDSERKRPLPQLPSVVGVVTSPQAAALQDFLNVAHRRFGGLHVRIVPAAVQGPEAAKQVADGIRLLNRHGGCDVVVVTRGGGSLEDLWPFNDEGLARAVAASDLPIISAVGHEVDLTLCDLAADLRAPTPSAAAELVVRNRTELLERLRYTRQRLRDRLQLGLQALEARVSRAAHSRVFQTPAHLLEMRRQQVDEFSMRMTRAMQRRTENAENQILQARQALNALSPRNVLERGYAILKRPDRPGVLADAEGLAVGEPVDALLARGRARLTVTGTTIPEVPTDE